MDIYSKAIDAYNKACSLVEGLFKEIKDEKLVKERFSRKKMMENFDILVQYSMMQVALSDKDFSSKEVKFISKLSKYCSFVTYLNNLGFNDVTWDKLFFIKAEVLKSILDKIKVNVQELSEDFIKYFSLIDAKKPDCDYAKELYNYMIAIMSAVILSDGKWKESEKELPLIIVAIAIIKQRKKNIK